LSLFTATFQALAPLFVLILLGYGLKRTRMLHSAHVPVLNGIVVNVTMPALIVRGLVTAPAIPSGTILLPCSMVLAEVILAGIVYVCVRVFRLSTPLKGALLLVGIFGNTAFLGYPITLALLPHQFPAAILIDQFGMGVPMYTTAALIGAAYGASSQKTSGLHGVLKFIRSPLFLSLLIGSILREIPWPRELMSASIFHMAGIIVGKCLTYLGQGTTPIVLLALGVALRPAAAKAHLPSIALACCLKLILSPLLMWQICRIFGIQENMLAVGVLLAGMPTSVMASVLAGHHDMEGDFAVGTVFITTMLSAVTIPIWLQLVGIQ
jgi:predicted permease